MGRLGCLEHHLGYYCTHWCPALTWPQLHVSEAQQPPAPRLPAPPRVQVGAEVRGVAAPVQYITVQYITARVAAPLAAALEEPVADVLSPVDEAAPQLSVGVSQLLPRPASIAILVHTLHYTLGDGGLVPDVPGGGEGEAVPWPVQRLGVGAAAVREDRHAGVQHPHAGPAYLQYSTVQYSTVQYSTVS